jgi:hypothetical protein
MAQEGLLLVVPRADEGSPRRESLPEPNPAQHFASLQGVLKDVFTYRAGFRRYEGSDQSLDVGHWWLRDQAKAGAPLSDRVEMALVRYLQQHPGCTLMELDSALCEVFPGLLTPDLELIQVCLDSYGEQEPAETGFWRLRAQDTPSARRFDLDVVRRLVMRLGEQLGFITNADQDLQAKQTGKPVIQIPFTWRDKAGTARFEFYILTSAALGELVLQAQREEGGESTRVILLPGGRANLAAYKLENNPYLKQEIESGWHIVKYRHLRHLAESPFLTPEIFKDQLNQDSITYSMPQMRLL